MKSFSKAVLLTTLLAGTTDLASAYVTEFIKTGKFAYWMLQVIAGGALGLQAALKGGLPASLLGLIFHYFIAFVFTLLFFIVYPKLRLRSLNRYFVWIVFGVAYAGLVDLVMNFIVLPLSKLPSNGPYLFAKIFPGWLIFAAVFTIPIAICADLYYRRKMLTRQLSAEASPLF